MKLRCLVFASVLFSGCWNEPATSTIMITEFADGSATVHQQCGVWYRQERFATRMQAESKYKEWRKEELDAKIVSVQSMP